MRIDCHNHCSTRKGRWPPVARMVSELERLGVSRACCSIPITSGEATPDKIREANDDIAEAMRQFPKQVFGYCFLHPGYAREAQDEITRCVVDGGMIGVKLYHQHCINEPVQYPIIERCIDLGVPILMHAARLIHAEDLAGQLRVSAGEHFVDVARRYPEAMLICGHIGGGGDWEWQIKALRDAPSVYLDTSGSVIDQGMIERCVRDLGAKRLLFATDMLHARGVGKLLDAEISERDRTLIFGENFQKILARRRL